MRACIESSSIFWVICYSMQPLLGLFCHLFDFPEFSTRKWKGTNTAHPDTPTMSKHPTSYRAPTPLRQPTTAYISNWKSATACITPLKFQPQRTHTTEPSPPQRACTTKTQPQRAPPHQPQQRSVPTPLQIPPQRACTTTNPTTAHAHRRESNYSTCTSLGTKLQHTHLTGNATKAYSHTTHAT